MRTRQSVAIGAALATVVALGGVMASPTAAVAASCARTNVSDFNGDGVSDVAIGETGASRFHVIYGHHGTLNATTPQDQLINGPADVSAFFAITMVTGDFNNDGCADLAVADWGRDEGDVTIYLGSTSGLQPAKTVLTGDERAPAVEQFGYALAVGDVNDDGRDDLIVGSPGDSSIFVFLGTAGGIQKTGTQYKRGGPSAGFGSAVAAGDFNADGHADVAVGAPSGGTGGQVYVFPGGTTSAPLQTTGAQTWSQASAGVPGTPENGDHFGAALAAGNFLGNGAYGLAVGVPGEGLGQLDGAGLVDVLYSGGAGGLTGTGARQWDQTIAGVPGTAIAGERFGEVLTSADFNGDSHDDLAVGQPRGTVGTHPGAGDVTVLYAGTGDAGLTTDGAQRFTQSTAGVGGTPEDQDNFGNSLAAVRVTHSGEYDLVVGVDNEGLGSFTDDGVMQLLPGSPGGLGGAGTETWDDGSGGVKGASCNFCGFGIAVAGTAGVSAL
jgi:hypothetical protein